MPEVCLQYKNPRFTAFSDSNLHTRLAIVTENELGLAFPPRNLLKKFRPDSSTFYLVFVVTNKQTNRQTNDGDSIIPRFRGDNNDRKNLLLAEVPADDVDAVAEHGQVLKTRSVLAEAGQSKQDPERALVGVGTKQRVFVLKSTLTDEVVRRVRQKLTVHRRHPRKLLYVIAVGFTAYATTAFVLTTTTSAFL